MPKEQDTQGAAPDKVTPSPAERGGPRAEAGHRSGAGSEARGGPERVPGGLERIREILLGDILAELERRLARIDSQLANRTSELHHDARLRTDVLEAHVRREVEALAQRMARIEERVESQLARIEREVHQQLLDQAKSFLDELERVRRQLRAAIAHELGLEPASLEEGSPHHDGAWAAPH